MKNISKSSASNSAGQADKNGSPFFQKKGTSNPTRAPFFTLRKPPLSVNGPVVQRTKVAREDGSEINIESHNDIKELQQILGRQLQTGGDNTIIQALINRISKLSSDNGTEVSPRQVAPPQRGYGATTTTSTRVVGAQVPLGNPTTGSSSPAPRRAASGAGTSSGWGANNPYLLPSGPPASQQSQTPEVTTSSTGPRTNAGPATSYGSTDAEDTRPQWKAGGGGVLALDSTLAAAAGGAIESGVEGVQDSRRGGYDRIPDEGGAAASAASSTAPSENTGLLTGRERTLGDKAKALVVDKFENTLGGTAGVVKTGGKAALGMIPVVGSFITKALSIKDTARIKVLAIDTRKLRDQAIEYRQSGRYDHIRANTETLLGTIASCLDQAAVAEGEAGTAQAIASIFGIPLVGALVKKVETISFATELKEALNGLAENASNGDQNAIAFFERIGNVSSAELYEKGADAAVSKMTS